MLSHLAELVAILAIFASGGAVALLLTRKSLGCYTAQIQQSNSLTRQSHEHVRQEIDRAREYNVAVMLELLKMERRLKPLLDANPEQRSA
jgi:hypothetical protein